MTKLLSTGSTVGAQSSQSNPSQLASSHRTHALGRVRHFRRACPSVSQARDTAAWWYAAVGARVLRMAASGLPCEHCVLVVVPSSAEAARVYASQENL